jgi:chemotaxis protein methyltransferase CheR
VLESAPVLGDRVFADIASLMHSSIGLSFPESKKSLVASRLAPRVQRLGLRGFDDYLALIQRTDDQGEFQMAVDLLTTNETYFFREPAHYALIEQELLRERPRRVAVWSAASSFGDEAYSTAMLLADLQRQGHIGDDWSILGTDISDRVLHSAMAGIFPAMRLRLVEPQRLKRYCLRGEGENEGQVAVQPKLRQRVRFGQLNLCAELDSPLPGAPFDIVFLRNVLIYFDAPTKRDVVDRVLTQLRSGGLFLIGTAEGRVACRTPLKSLAPGVFRKDEGRT